MHSKLSDYLTPKPKFLPSIVQIDIREASNIKLSEYSYPIERIF